MEETFALFPSASGGTRRFRPQDLPTLAATGFTAAAEDYMERGIDLNEQLIHNRPATFFLRVNGHAMVGAGIHHGDVLIVDRSLNAGDGKIIIAVLSGEMIVRRLRRISNQLFLVPEAPQLASIEIHDSSDFEVWGVVTYVIHPL